MSGMSMQGVTSGHVPNIRLCLARNMVHSGRNNAETTVVSMTHVAGFFEERLGNLQYRYRSGVSPADLNINQSQEYLDLST